MMARRNMSILMSSLIDRAYQMRRKICKRCRIQLRLDAIATTPHCGKAVGNIGRQHVTQIFTMARARLHGHYLGTVIFVGKIGNS